MTAEQEWKDRQAKHKQKLEVEWNKTRDLVHAGDRIVVHEGSTDGRGYDAIALGEIGRNHGLQVAVRRGNQIIIHRACVWSKGHVTIGYPLAKLTIGSLAILLEWLGE